MPMPKKVREWDVKQTKNDKGHVIVTLNHPEFGFIQSRGEAGIDSNIVFENAVLGAYEEEKRRADLSGMPNAEVETLISEQKNAILTAKQARSIERAEAEIERMKAEGDK